MPKSLPVPEWMTKPLEKDGPQFYPPSTNPNRSTASQSKPSPPRPVVPVIVQSLPLVRAPPPPNQGPPPPPIPGTVPPLNLQPTTWTVYPTPPGAPRPRPTEGQVVLAAPITQSAHGHPNRGPQTAPAQPVPQASNPSADPSKTGAVQGPGVTAKPAPAPAPETEATQTPTENNTEPPSDSPREGSATAPEATEPTSASPKN